MGGRLDSTNVITPEVSVITNIGFDHMDILGDTLEKIAIEKAGIIKPGIPVVIGETTSGNKKCFLQKANEKNAPILFAEDIYKIISTNSVDEVLQIEIVNRRNKVTAKYNLDLAGFYQAKNLLTVLTATDVLRNMFTLSDENITQALANVKRLSGLRGRWEIIHRKPSGGIGCSA